MKFGTDEGISTCLCHTPTPEIFPLPSRGPRSRERLNQICHVVSPCARQRKSDARTDGNRLNTTNSVSRLEKKTKGREIQRGEAGGKKGVLGIIKYTDIRVYLILLPIITADTQGSGAIGLLKTIQTNVRKCIPQPEDVVILSLPL